MLGLEVALRIRNFHDHMLFLRVMHHCTAVLLLSCEGKIFFFKHPLIDVSAWGGGGKPKTPEQNEAEKMRRRLKRQHVSRDKRNDARDSSRDTGSTNSLQSLGQSQRESSMAETRRPMRQRVRHRILCK